MKILVIEDRLEVRISIEQILTEAGYLVDAIADGIETTYRAQNWEYDAVILDVMLPKVDGWKVFESIRKSGDTPVIMLTALGELDHRLKGLNGTFATLLTDQFSDYAITSDFFISEPSAYLLILGGLRWSLHWEGGDGKMICEWVVGSRFPTLVTEEDSSAVSFSGVATKINRSSTSTSLETFFNPRKRARSS